MNSGAEGRLERGLVVGVGEVLDGHGLGAVVLADPVGVRQVDADRGRGVAGAADRRPGDDLGRDALDLFLLEPGIDRRVVLEPLGVGRDDVGPLRRRQVLEVDDRLPAALHAQRIVVDLGEAVDEVDERGQVADPEDGVFVELGEVARPVVGDEGLDDLLLLLVLGDPGGLLEPEDDLGDGRAVEAVDLGDLFDDLAVLLDDPGVQAVGDRGLVLLVDDALVIGLDLGLGDALVEVDGGVRRPGPWSNPGTASWGRRPDRTGWA